MLDVGGDIYLTADEACQLLAVKPATLYAYVSRGLIRSYRQGIRRQRLYRRSELEALLRIEPADTPSSIPPAESWVTEK
jgi:excisionase family DNA binding protein